MAWTQEKTEQLKQLATEKLSRIEIAKRIGTTERAVSGKLFALGLRSGRHNSGPKIKYRWDDDKTETLARLWLTHTSESIAEILNCSRAAVWRQSRVIGLPKRCAGYERTIQCIRCNTSVKSYFSTQKYCKECAELVSKETKKKYKRVLNLVEPVWPQERIDQMLDLHAKGFSASSIADKLGGCSRNAVIGKLHRLGFGRPQTRESRKTNAKLGGMAARRKRSIARIKIAKPPKQYTAKPKISLTVNGNAPNLVPLEHEPIHLVQIKNGQCKFIEGDDRMCCGREALNGFSWCPHHYVRAHILDRRSASMAGVHQQPLAHRTGQEHTKPELQEMDRRSPNRTGITEGEVSFG